MASLIASALSPPPPPASLRRPAKSISAALITTAIKPAGMKFAPKISQTPLRSSRIISCAVTQAETLRVVQTTIAKQLSVEECAVMPETKFVDLGADSLDTVEIMMALEEKFGVSIGEAGAENIATVQDAADLIEKVKAAAA